MMYFSRNVQSRPVSAQPRGRRGFSFTEILFAVMILGIGFIMVAAMFPAAMKQTQETLEETAGADVAKEGAGYLQKIGSDKTLPMMSRTVPAANIDASWPCYPVLKGGQWPQPAAPATDFWGLCSPHLIYSADSRYAWVPFYVRNQVVDNPGAPAAVPAIPTTYKDASNAQVVLISVLVRNKSTFKAADDLVAINTPGDVPNLQGRLLPAQFRYDPNPLQPDYIQFPGGTGNEPSAAEGAYVIIADDGALADIANAPMGAHPWTPPLKYNSCVGSVYRLGANTGGMGGISWELMPGNDLKLSRNRPVDPTSNSTTWSPSVSVYIVGRGYTERNFNTSSYSFFGQAMDISAYTTWINTPKITP